MKYLLAFLALTVAAFAAEPVVSVDLYGNVFLNGENTNRQIGDFARDPANYALAPQIDAAVRDAALAGRARIAADIQAAQASATAQVAAKEAEKVEAIAAKDAMIAERDATIAALQAQVAELQAQLAAAQTPPSPQP